MRKYKYLVGYRGDGNIMYGKYHTGVNQDGRKKPCNEDYAEPMTLHQAKKAVKKLPCDGAAIFELVEVEQP